MWSTKFHFFMEPLHPWWPKLTRWSYPTRSHASFLSRSLMVASEFWASLMTISTCERRTSSHFSSVIQSSFGLLRSRTRAIDIPLGRFFLHSDIIQFDIGYRYRFSSFQYRQDNINICRRKNWCNGRLAAYLMVSGLMMTSDSLDSHVPPPSSHMCAMSLSWREITI